MLFLKEIASSLLHLAFPQLCAGCGKDLPDDRLLCLRCTEDLPLTGFQYYADNPIEKIFWGRLPLQSATAQYYFTRNSAMQKLMHRFKYRSHRETGEWLGRTMGRQLAESQRFDTVDALVPLPLFPSRERRRGYNQSFVLCGGIAAFLNIPVLKDAVTRTLSTESQTRKSRVERWQNMEGRFELVDPSAINGRHLLLVDDVVTTGATLEACGRVLLGAKDVQLSIATLCYSHS